MHFHRFWLFLLVFSSCALDSSNPDLTHTDGVMQKFEQENKTKIIARYKTNVYRQLAKGHSEGGESCASMDLKDCIYLLDDKTAHCFHLRANLQDCPHTNIVDTFFLSTTTWKPYKQPSVNIKTLPCEFTKLQLSYIVGRKDNPPASKHFVSDEIFVDENYSRTFDYQEICLSADTLLIGYDNTDQPIYLYKY